MDKIPGPVIVLIALMVFVQSCILAVGIIIQTALRRRIQNKGDSIDANSTP